MLIKYRHYAYPVLGEGYDSYKNVNFICNAEQPVTAGNNLKFSITSKTSDDKINELIMQGRAEFVHHIEDPQTFYRKVFRTKEEKFEILIEDKKLNGKVHLCSFIVATEDIQNFKSVNFSDDYKGFDFDISKGSILGVKSHYVFLLNKDKDDLLDTASFVKIRKSVDEGNKNATISLDGNLIIIYLPIETFSEWKKAKHDIRYNPLISSLIVVPALVHVIELMKNSSGNIENFRWYLAMTKILKSFNIEVEKGDLESQSSFELAQKLLNSPLNESFSSLWSEGGNM